MRERERACVCVSVSARESECVEEWRAVGVALLEDDDEDVLDDDPDVGCRV